MNARHQKKRTKNQRKGARSWKLHRPMSKRGERRSKKRKLSSLLIHHSSFIARSHFLLFFLSRLLSCSRSRWPRYNFSLVNVVQVDTLQITNKACDVLKGKERAHHRNRERPLLSLPFCRRHSSALLSGFSLTRTRQTCFLQRKRGLMC